MAMGDGATRRRGFGTRYAALVVAVAVAVVIGIGASLAWGKTGPAPVGTGVAVIETSLVDGRGAGTGMVLTSSGRVLTNNHVIRGASTIQIRFPGTGRSYSAKVLGYSVSKDVALLKANAATNLKTVSLGNSATLRIGHSVTATGNAGGTGSLTTSSGSVTGLGRAITVGDESGSQRLRGLIRTSSELRPGDSGGPLFDSAHRVVGMNTAANVGSPFRGTRGADGYAIPINAAIVIAKQIVAGKGSPTVHVGPTAFLGVAIASTTGRSGVVIARVVRGSGADGAGLTAGDVITSLGGRAVSSPATLRSAILRLKPGASVSVTYVDAITGATESVSLTLRSGPPQ
ncbi:MAG TPA: trypsin-like peptidase domain-containing protein [Thermoleophilaceae bacterium]|jgi:S1-C subfamily serine protease|nr:trypsin-like peptidase domain-containing protein [Thermoleophilaceae bacterium]